MAKKEETTKIVLERVYNVPLRREFLKVASWKRTKKATKALKEFISKHMKSDNVNLGKFVNKELWKHGIKNPPHHVKISAKKNDKGRVDVELAELPANAKRKLEKQKTLEKRKEDKEAEKKKAEDATKKAEEKKEETLKTKEHQIKKEVKKEEGKVVEAEFKEEKKEQAKKEEKEELKEIKKEIPKQAPKPLAAPKQVEQRPTAPKSQ
jgi:large subunit ribosomal protein L31e